MIRATYDTNTLASGTISVQGAVSFVIDAWINDEIEMVTSQPLIDEFIKTLTKPYFLSRLTQDQAQALIDLVKTRATVVAITTVIPRVATHPEDDIVLATAESGKADYIVTGDHGLQKLKEFKGIRIVSPKAFTELLQTEKIF